jgi:hypothetical protein
VCHGGHLRNDRGPAAAQGPVQPQARRTAAHARRTAPQALTRHRPQTPACRVQRPEIGAWKSLIARRAPPGVSWRSCDAATGRPDARPQTRP